MSFLGSRRLSVFTLGGQRVDLLNLRLSLIDRNFDHRDYEALLALDTQSPETPHFGSHPPIPVPKRRIEALKIMKKRNMASNNSNKNSCSSPDKAGNTTKKKGSSSVISRGGLDDDSSNNNNNNNNKGSSDDIVCSICLDTFEDDTLVMKLPCGHEFHDCCAQDWFTRKGMGSTCPNCNREVFK
jgi:hypothetical protein